jgi:AraC family transcriptional regulator, regulatory protein of adaptative response / methylated-DNA-[protein]-cysteine methyltransferase
MTVTFAQFDTKLGPMIAIANEKAVILLEFIDRKNLDQEITKIEQVSNIVQGLNAPLVSIEKELESYFAGTLKEFTTPYVVGGSPLQIKVWTNLLHIPYGTTTSYGQLTQNIQSTATRAVATAIGQNRLAILIPCHRVISKSGSMGGYAAGLVRKRQLLDLEKGQLS